jgi:hypothetical protein
VIGEHNGVTGTSQYGLDWEATSAWVAFRPPGGGLRRAVKLPSRGVLPGEPRVAENNAGVTLFTWETERGAYLAWGDPEGRISRPSFISHGLKVAAIGVDEHGEALVIGYYWDKATGHTSSIVAVTARAYGAFSRPRVIAAEPRDARGKVTSEFKEPVAAVGPTGAAVIIWETWQPRDAEGPGLLVYRYADGRFTHPQRIAKDFLEVYGILPATVDAAGRALILHETGYQRWREVTVMPGGRLGPERTLPKGEFDPMLAGNERGETVIGLGEHNSMLFVFGDAFGDPPVSETIATPNQTWGAVVTIDGTGQATAVWIERPKEAVTLVNARAVAPGAQTVQIARGELKP